MAMIRDKTAGAFLIKQNPLTFHDDNGRNGLIEAVV